MARDKTDKTDLTPATLATSATNTPKRYNRGKDGTHPLDKSFKPRLEGVVEELGGDELQKLRVTWSYEISLFAEGDFWRDLEAILANCDEIMLRHGWDRKAGNGRDFPGDRTAEPFSELWYAGKIGFECWNLLTWHREHGPNEIALSQALYLGKLLTEAEWRGAFGPSIHTGRKQRRNLSDIRNGQNRAAQADVAARREAIAAMLLETTRTGGALDRWLVARLQERHGITVAERTVRSDRHSLAKRWADQ
jgi:hypothetical protein